MDRLPWGPAVRRPQLSLMISSGTSTLTPTWTNTARIWHKPSRKIEQHKIRTISVSMEPTAYERIRLSKSGAGGW